jgi:hypothetical protein
LFASNLANKMYYVTERNQLATYDVVMGQPGRPREFLFTVKKSFCRASRTCLAMRALAGPSANGGAVRRPCAVRRAW